jgi:dephospho-CoA kinase
MLKIGITGGIGAGKSTVSQLFKTLGVPVYNSDERAKWLMNHDLDLKIKIIKLFGDNAYTSHEEVDRMLIAQKVFNDKLLLVQLNALVHPAVKKDYLNWSISFDKKKYSLKESALLFETGIYKELDKNILVVAPLNIRIERVMKRDGISQELVEQRIKNQLPEEEKIPLADYIIYNDESNSLIEQVLTIHQQISQL